MMTITALGVIHAVIGSTRIGQDGGFGTFLRGGGTHLGAFIAATLTFNITAGAADGIRDGLRQGREA